MSVSGHRQGIERAKLLPHLYDNRSPTEYSIDRHSSTEQRVKVANAIDHTLLKPTATKLEVVKLCDEAVQYNFASVCVSGCRARLARRLLHGTPIKTCAVIGFPNGTSTPAAKAAEASELVLAGIDEIDMVINVGALIESDFEAVLDDIEAVVGAVRAGSAARGILKVILECGSLGEANTAVRQQRIAEGCVLSVLAGAHFVKTSTGFNNFGGALKEDVALMRVVVGDELEVKASGGVRTFDDALAIMAAGATRIGASAGVAIVGEAAKAGGGKKQKLPEKDEGAAAKRAKDDSY